MNGRSSRPRSNPHQVDEALRRVIVARRASLTAEGLDAESLTIAWHLEQRGLRVPSASSIRRVLVGAGLVGAGLVRPEPTKRPAASLRRFSADQPHETWQSDFTHWRVRDRSDVEIIDWLDDHSGDLLHLRAHRRVTGPIVIESFSDCVNEFGLSTSTLTDNAVVDTTRLVSARNGFENLLATLGVTQKNGHTNHPQTQGTIERFHQTLKKWLAQQPAAATLAELQRQLDRFRDLYNERRPHRALDRATPASAYRATPKAVAGHPCFINTVSVSTRWTSSARLRFVTAGSSITSASAPIDGAPGSCYSSARSRSPSPVSTPVRCSPSTTSTMRATTGKTTCENPVAGRSDYQRCRDSSHRWSLGHPIRTGPPYRGAVLECSGGMQFRARTILGVRWLWRRLMGLQ